MISKTYGIAGNGRLAGHLLRYFRSKGLPIQHWHRQMDRTAQQVLHRVDIVLVLIADDAIESWIKKNPWLKNKITIHCSGSLVTKLAQGFHPLFNFTQKTYPETTYEKIPFVFEKGVHTFYELFPHLPNPSFEISKKDRPLYHALCVMTGNFPTMLWQSASNIFSKKMKLPPTFFVPYLQNCIDQFEKDPANALTGPFVRKDKKTIEKNLKALKNSPLQQIYKAFSKQYPKLKK